MTEATTTLTRAVPNDRIRSDERAAAIGISAEVLNERIGFETLARKGHQQEASDLAFFAVTDMVSRTGIALGDLGCIVVVTQNPDNFGIPQVSALLHAKLGLQKSEAAFDISLGCSGYVYGLGVLSSFLRLLDVQTGVLVTVDPYSKIVDADDRATALIFGDGASATLINRSGEWRLGEFDFGTSGEHASLLRVDDQRKFLMNGPAVARVCIREVPLSIHRALDLNHITLDDIDCVLLHQASRVVVHDIAHSLNAESKTPFLAGAIGNTTCSSIPIALQSLLASRPDLRRVVLSGFGVGMSWASTVIQRASIQEEEAYG